MPLPQKQQRQIAIRAARSHLRHMGVNPAGLTSGDALRALDDLARIDAATIAARWYVGASDNQISLFCQEWQRLTAG